MVMPCKMEPTPSKANSIYYEYWSETCESDSELINTEDKKPNNSVHKHAEQVAKRLDGWGPTSSICTQQLHIWILRL